MTTARPTHADKIIAGRLIDGLIVGNAVPDFDKPTFQPLHVLFELEELEQGVVTIGAAKDCA